MLSKGNRMKEQIFNVEILAAEITWFDWTCHWLLLYRTGLCHLSFALCNLGLSNDLIGSE